MDKAKIFDSTILFQTERLSDVRVLANRSEGSITRAKGLSNNSERWPIAVYGPGPGKAKRSERYA